LGIKERPEDLALRQACAAVGQSRLMATYDSLFRHFDQPIAQVLLTHEDLADHERHLNARNTLLTLLKRGVLPIINENDAVSVTELKFGDNDRLSALVASLLPADLLVILTTADGLIEGFGTPQARLLDVVERIDERIEGMAGGTTSVTATDYALPTVSATTTSPVPSQMVAGTPVQCTVTLTGSNADDIGMTRLFPSCS
jgi:glutamate 5-kinase